MTATRINNFDFLRLIFATFVVISHSFWITGNFPKETIYLLTSGQIDLGTLGVKGFFVISGYFVFKSLIRSKNIIHYFIKRLLRLYPALLILSLFIVLVIPFLYYGPPSLLSNKDYLHVIPNILKLYSEPIKVDGVFTSHPKNEINMSLWTLPYEFSCYIILAILFFIKSKFRLLITAITFIISWYLACYKSLWLNGILFNTLHLQSYYFYDLACFFSSGILLSFLNFSKLKFRFSITLLLFFLLIISIHYHYFFYVKYLLIPPIILLIGTYQKGFFSNIGHKWGDISYGVYIYGWFIQQILYHFFHLNEWLLTVSSLPIIYFLGWLSWNFIEKKALKLKTKLK